MVNQNKIFSFKIKRQAKNVFPSDVESTVDRVHVTQQWDKVLGKTWKQQQQQQKKKQKKKKKKKKEKKKKKKNEQSEGYTKTVNTRTTALERSVVKTTDEWINHLYLVSNKRNIGKQWRPRSDAAERGVWSGSTLFALNTCISVKHGDNIIVMKQRWSLVTIISDTCSQS